MDGSRVEMVGSKITRQINGRVENLIVGSKTTRETDGRMES